MTKLVYDFKGEWLLELEGEGSVFVREQGGPRYHFGALHNVERPTLSAWRVCIPASRRAAILAGFAEARSMNDCNFSLVPDEHASSLTADDATLLVVHRALESNIALDRVVTELSGIANALFAAPPTDRFANPERDLWAKASPFSFDRRLGPDAPEVQPTGRERAQAAVDRFYEGGLDASMEHLAARWKTRAAVAMARAIEAAPLENAQYTFTCRATGQPAGTVSLRLTPLASAGELELSGFSPTSNATVRVKDDELRTLRRQLLTGDARALWNRDLTLAPFYCSQCDACYAASQWKVYETSPTRIEGSCPAEHRRRMHAM